jgi:deoxyribodipyrimidine photo-lyase
MVSVSCHRRQITAGTTPTSTRWETAEVGRADVQVVWFKRDLRVHDHAPLTAAARAGAVIPLYIVEPDVVWASADHDPRHWAFLRECLVDLDTSLRRLGTPLVVRVGDAVEVLEQLRADHGVAAIHGHEETGNLATYARDRAVGAWARRQRVAFHETPQAGVIRRLTSRDDWGSRRQQRLAAPVIPPPDQLVGIDLPPGELPPAPAQSTWTWRQEGGETLGRRRLMEFLAGGVRGYETALSSPVTAWDGCSRLSPHFAYGTVSLHEAVRRTEASTGRADPALKASLKAFGERLAWHDHFVQKLEDEPELERRSYIPEFDALRPDADPRLLEAWATGHTGYPFLDACLRSLAATGWINFRMRAMLVTFAAHDLWLPWQSFGHQLARWFTDYEPGIHWPQVQMQSATAGINTVRVYNPVKQGLDHDPTGEFTRTWVPELAHLPTEHMHQPWRFDVRPASYPPPLVDHAVAAARATERVEALRRRLSPQRRDVLERHGSRRPAPPRRPPRRRPM